MMTPAQRAMWHAYLDLQARRKLMPEDTLLDYTFPARVLLGLKTMFVTTPKTVWKGLKGSSDFTFADAMLMAKVPYYLGGLGIVLSPLLGGGNAQAIRAGVSVALYMLGIGIGNGWVNLLDKLRFGVDHNLSYRSRTGQIEGVFVSEDFPRFDLLAKAEYQKMARKQGVPDDIYEQDGAVRENLRYIIASRRTLKILLGVLLSAIGAGYIARAKEWDNLPDAIRAVRSTWQTPATALSYRNKLAQSAVLIKDTLKGPILQRMGRVGLAGLAAMGASALYILVWGLPRKQFREGPIQVAPFNSMDLKTLIQQEGVKMPLRHAGNPMRSTSS